jgi:hypothetical protein
MDDERKKKENSQSAKEIEELQVRPSRIGGSNILWGGPSLRNNTTKSGGRQPSSVFE